MASLDFPPIVELEDSLEAIQDFYETQGWSDGLPFVPPTRDRVRGMYQHVQWAPSDVIATLGPRNGEATLERIATNAVMAGCRPEYLPIVIAALQAMAEDAFNLTGIQATTHPCAALTLVNGPLAEELAINSGPNCFGQGTRANMAIGRAIRLSLLNIGGGTPGDGDRATHGTPAKIAYCAAENEAASPWEPMHVERGFDAADTVVTVLACEAPHNINDHASIGGAGLLQTVAMSMRQAGSNNMGGVASGTGRGNPLLVLGPEHAAQIARDGLTKADVKQYVWERARLATADWAEEWRTEDRLGRMRHLTGQDEYARLMDRPDDLDVIVAGGPGKHSCWMPTFGDTKTIRRRVEHPDGTPVRSIFNPS